MGDMERLKELMEKARDGRSAIDRKSRAWCAAMRSRLADASGQGTTEYAILVGVLTKLDSVLAKKHEVGGLPCSR